MKNETKAEELFAKIESLNSELSERKSELESFKSRSDSLSKQLQENKETLKERENLLDQKHTEFLKTQKELAELKTSLTEKEKYFSDQLKTLQENKEAMKNEFTSLANDILEKKSSTFAEQNKERLETLMSPFKEQIEGFRKKVEEIHASDTKQRINLEAELRHIKELNRQMAEEAHSLTSALKGDTKAQGDWGEMRLERLLELSGLKEGVEWVRQGKSLGLTSDDGRSKKPDIVIFLPEDRNIIIDSKVSITSYHNYIKETDEALKSSHVKSYLTSFQKHIKDLSETDYQHLDGINSPDFVLMFVPTDGAYSFALEQDQQIYQKALEKKILLVSPALLVPLLRTIELMWRQDKQFRNATEISKRGGMLYDKFVNFVEDLEKVGQRLEDSQTAYSEAFKKLKSGRGNLISQAEKLKAMGSTTKKQLNDQLLIEADKPGTLQ